MAKKIEVDTTNILKHGNNTVSGTGLAPQDKTDSKVRIMHEIKSNSLSTKGHFQFKLIDQTGSVTHRFSGKLTATSFIQVELRAEDSNDNTSIAAEGENFIVIRMGTADFATGKVEFTVMGTLGEIQMNSYLITSVENPGPSTLLSSYNISGQGVAELNHPVEVTSA